MRIKSFEVQKFGPIQHVAVRDLADIVVLAGPNGVGKTSINNAILGLAQNPQPSATTWINVQATQPSEEKGWEQRELDTRKPQDCARLRSFLQRNRKRNRYEGSFLNFDSDRAIRNIAPFTFSWDITSPYAEDVGWNLGFQSLANRYNDVRHSLFRLVESQKREIADEALRQRAAGHGEMKLEFPDVLAPFKDAFIQLLAPKRLVEVNTREQQIYYEYQGTKLSIDQLSSGEREVVNIVFDFILRGPSHSVIIFDEPELHLHPELSYRLLQTLSTIGSSNQFIFSTHSPEIISASLENSVVFVTPPKTDGSNQAVVVDKDDETNATLHALGQSIGVIALGKKLVLIEGDESSLDKLTYGAILRSRFPEFVLVPIGGKSRIRSFDELKSTVLDRAVWGIQFFLLADRDATNLRPNIEVDPKTPNVRELPRYHLENYFLDATVLARALAAVEPEGSWLRDEAAIDQKLREIALSKVGYATALAVNALIRDQVGNVSVVPKQLDSLASGPDVANAIILRVDAEVGRVNSALDRERVRTLALEEYERISELVTAPGDQWKRDIPGRPILNIFAGREAKMQVGRLKQLYLSASIGTSAFDEVIAIFESFRSLSS